VKRREFITGLGAGAAWPLIARAQQRGTVRRIGVLVPSADNDSDLQARLAGLRQRLATLGWSEDRNLHIDVRFAAGRPDQFEPLARELVALKPDLIIAMSPPVVSVVQREARAIPIVFVDVSDAIGPGFIANLARPGGNVTGLLSYETTIVGKWLQMLKEIAPNLARVAVMSNPTTSSFDYFLGAAEAHAPSLGIELVSSRVDTAAGIERTIESFARSPNGGLLLPPDTTTIVHRDLIIALAARHRLPAVYPFRFFVAAGGLMSYSVDWLDEFRQAATYVDRILRGERPADLPVQAPVKYETVLNLKTAKALGLTVPDLLLVRADEVIE
jgi:putative tryptophan/tyrosine transport system substrate-binding protein